MKAFGGKQYHVNCLHHPNQWVCHTTAECSKNPINAGTPPPGQTTERKLPGAKLAASLSDDSGNTEEESEGDDD
jgi:hypothetical protein